MISVRLTNDMEIDYNYILDHCPVAKVSNALECLHRFIAISTVIYVGYIKGEIACMYGLKSPSILSTDQAYIWILTTDVVDTNKFEFIRHSEVVIESILKEYGKIVGETLITDTQAFKWLRWLGAIYSTPKGSLVPFYITRETFMRRRGQRWQTP